MRNEDEKMNWSKWEGREVGLFIHSERNWSLKIIIGYLSLKWSELLFVHDKSRCPLLTPRLCLWLLRLSDSPTQKTYAFCCLWTSLYWATWSQPRPARPGPAQTCPFLLESLILHNCIIVLQGLTESCYYTLYLILYIQSWIKKLVDPLGICHYFIGHLPT